MDERRYFGLDALRGGMMMLGIVLHAAWLYLAAPPPTMPISDFLHGRRFDLNWPWRESGLARNRALRPGADSR
jgi:hypothetical protein